MAARPHDLEPITIDTPYVPFPENPKTIRVGRYDVFEYITPEVMGMYIKSLGERVEFDNFDAVLVNLNGGEFLFRTLAEFRGYKGTPIYIEYHRPDGGFGADEVIPIPPEVIGKKALVIDDIYDSGGVLKKIMGHLAPNSLAIVAVTKNGIDGQIAIPNAQIAVRIDNKWVGGCGMDLGMKEEGTEFRVHSGLVVKIE